MRNFAAIDFETANGKRTSVCSVGVVIVRNSPFDEGCLRAVHLSHKRQQRKRANKNTTTIISINNSRSVLL